MMLDRRKVIEGLEQIALDERLQQKSDYYVLVCMEALRLLRKQIIEELEARNVDTLKVCNVVSCEFEDEIYDKLGKQYLAKAIAEKLKEDGYITFSKHKEDYEPNRVVFEARLDVVRPRELKVKWE